MKYKEEDLITQVEEGLKINKVNPDDIKRIHDAIEMIHKSNFPYFDGLDYLTIEPESKSEPVIVKLVSEVYNKIITLKCMENSVVISDYDSSKEEDNSARIFDFILGDNERIAKFRYGEDIIYIKGVKGDVEDIIKQFIAQYGGYSAIYVNVYTNVGKKYDLSELEFDFSKSYSANLGAASVYLNGEHAFRYEQSLDYFINLGIEYHNSIKKGLDIYEPIKIKK